jgi:signal transduction histidine kinase
MADSLASTVERLRASESQNRRFVSDVSHELRTPLTALVAEASVIEAGLDGLPADARRAAELLVADVRRLRVLVEDLMELSRFDARAEQAELRPTDLGDAVRSIVAARLPQAHLALADTPIVVDADVRRLDRILGNVLDNARVHAPGSRVDVEVRREGEAALVSVTDHGPGVAPEALPHLFDRFYKADASRSGGSSGLGLAIAAEHAALLGGTLEAAGHPGGGLAVTLRLPVTEPLPAGDGPDTWGSDAADGSDAAAAPTEQARPNA